MYYPQGKERRNKKEEAKRERKVMNMSKWKHALVAAAFLFVVAIFAGGGNAQAASTYKIKVNKQCCTVTVYKLTDGKYKAVKAMVCSPGYATPTGTFPLGEKMKWHTLQGPSYGQYCTRITGSILFHSVWYYQVQKNTQSYVQYNRLGTLASHGCVRLTVADAKWIYDNVPSGSPVKIYNSSNPGPLGKPAAIKVNGYQGWDPTDPDPANPYHKKNPKIKGVKKKVTVKYGEKYNPKEGVTATNTTGYNATSRIKVKVYYRLDTTMSYEAVKKVDTKTPGIYKVVYSVKDEIGHKAKKKSIVTVKASELVKEITLNKTEKILYIGGEDTSLSMFQLKVKKIKPASAPIKDVTFSSAGKKVATVTENGLIQAVSPGQVYITASAMDGSGVTSRCLITVEQLVTKITVKAPKKKIPIGTVMQLKTTILPKDAANKAVTYTSSNPEVATVDVNGSLTALSAGSTKIKVKAKDKGKVFVKIKIKVYDPDAVTPSDPASGSAVSGGSAEKEPSSKNNGGVPTGKTDVLAYLLGLQDRDSRTYGL